MLARILPLRERIHRRPVMVDVRLRVLRLRHSHRPVQEAKRRRLRRRDRRHRRRGLPGPCHPGFAPRAGGCPRRLAESCRREHRGVAQRRRSRRHLLPLLRRRQGAAARRHPLLGLGGRGAVRGAPGRASGEPPHVQQQCPAQRRYRRARFGLHPQPVPGGPRRPSGARNDPLVHRRSRHHHYGGTLRVRSPGHHRSGRLGEDRGGPLRLERSGGQERLGHLRAPDGPHLRG